LLAKVQALYDQELCRQAYDLVNASLLWKVGDGVQMRVLLGPMPPPSTQIPMPASTARSQNSVGAKIGAPWTMRRNRFSPWLRQSASA
jgi:hypothetical protein